MHDYNWETLCSDVDLLKRVMKNEVEDAYAEGFKRGFERGYEYDKGEGKRFVEYEGVKIKK